MHSLIIGVTNCGKTTLAKHIAKKHAEEFLRTRDVDKSIYIFDPMCSNGWTDYAECYSDEDYFLQNLPSFENGLVIIDECKLLYDRDANQLNKLLMQGRHRGLKTILMSQRYVNVPTNSRGNADTLYAFNQTPTDSDKAAKDYGKLPDLSRLKRFEFVQATQFTCSKVLTIPLDSK